MALHRYTRAVDGTIPVPALLYDDEELLASQDHTGIYDGLQKSPYHQAGTAYVTTHRLIYVPSSRAHHQLTRSFALDLAYITQTDFYAGLFKSSPKITIWLTPTASQEGNAPSELGSVVGVVQGFEGWECEVCGNRNPPGLSPTAAKVCALCGVPKASVPKPIPSPFTSQGTLSFSLPSSSLQSTFVSRSPTTSPALSSSPSPAPTPPPKPSGTNQFHTRQPSSIACPVCTFLNHPSMRSCEMCSTPLPRLMAPQSQLSLPPQQATKSAPSTRPVSPSLSLDECDTEDGTKNMIKLSFRKGGDKAFYAVLKRSVLGKAWDEKRIGKGRAAASTSGQVADRGTGLSGIHGIMQNAESSAQNTATDMLDALKDLDALMVKAKDMVRLAEELNERLTASSTTTTIYTPNIQPLSPLSPSAQASSSFATTLVPSTEPEEATFIRSSLSQLGLQIPNAPVTLDMIRDERKWVEELAKELGGVLQGSKKEGGMMKERGIVALDEVWGGWNRARGVALIPPSTFLLVLPHLPFFTNPPINVRTFPSGLSVLHTPPYSHHNFVSRLCSFITMSGPKTTKEIAEEEGMIIGLAGEMILGVERGGAICRDEGPEGAGKGGGGAVGTQATWWINVFEGYTWDGHVFET